MQFLLDKLIDHHPDEAQNRILSHEQILHEIYQSIYKNIEYLLNTRSTNNHYAEQYSHLRNSILNYGLPDTGYFYNTNIFMNQIKSTLELFEPRLKNIEIFLISNNNSKDKILRFRITGQLQIKSYHTVIKIDSKLNAENHWLELISISREENYD